MMVQVAERVEALAVWRVDPTHATVEFAVKHLMIATVKGRFGGVEATLQGSPGKPLAAIAEATIDVSTVDTGNPERDAHLRSADFFDVENYPSMRYVSHNVRQLDDREYEVEGDLTIRNVTRPVTLRATFEGLITDPWGNERIGVSAEGKIKRGDYNLEWNMPIETGGFVVGEDVKLSIHVEAVRAA
jgi:polyisoprenoid-binding protein YceI